MGQYARSCPTPNPKGGGKGGKPGAYKGAPKGGPKGGGGGGKGGKSQQICPTCGKTGHGKERCWETFPELKRKKKVQGVEGECNSVEMNGICIGAIDACVVCDCCPVGMDCNRCPAGSICDNDTMEPSWTIVSSISSKKGFAQTTAACSGALLGAGAHLGSGPSGMSRGQIGSVCYKEMATILQMTAIILQKIMQDLLQMWEQKTSPPTKSSTRRRRGSRGDTRLPLHSMHLSRPLLSVCTPQQRL